MRSAPAGSSTRSFCAYTWLLAVPLIKLGLHDPSDVIVGALIGALVASSASTFSEFPMD